MELQMVIAGPGGEGGIFMTRILAKSIFRHGHPVISSETHGEGFRRGVQRGITQTIEKEKEDD